MSHFTEIKTQIQDRKFLEQALKVLNLDFSYSEQGEEIRGFYGDHTSAQYKIQTGTDYDIGLRMTESGCYEFVADWEMLGHRKIDQQTFTAKIMQRYAYEKVKNTLEEQGYQVAEESVDEEGNIQLMVNQW